MTALPHRHVSFAVLAGIFLLVLLTAQLVNQPVLMALPFGVLLFLAGWRHLPTIFIALLATLAFSFEYNFTATLGTDIPDEALMALTGLLALAWWIYRPSLINRQMLSHPLLLLLLVHLCWIGIAAIDSTHPLLSVKYILAKGWYIGAFVIAPLIIFKEEKWIRLSAITLSVSVMIVVMIVLWNQARDGFSFESVNHAVKPFFRNHVNYSSMIVFTLPLLAAVYFLSKDDLVKAMAGASILILLIAIFFSYARGAWLAVATGLVAWWLLRRRWLLQGYIIAMVLAIAAVFWLKSNDRYLQYAHDFKTTIYHKDFKEHLVATYQLKDVSTAERFYRWIAGVRMIKDNRLTGTGPSTFYENYKPYGVPAFKTWVSDNAEQSTIHNYFLLLAVEQGIPGLVFFLVLLGAMLFYAQRLYIRISDPFYKTTAATAGAMIVMIATVNFLSDLVETDKVGSLFFLCFSVLVMVDFNNRKNSKFPVQSSR
jgi:O-antigen ligase